MRHAPTGRDRRPAGTSGGTRAGKARPGVASLLLVAAVLALAAWVYWPVHGFDFVSVDDSVYIARNPFLAGGPSWAGAARTFASTYAHFWHPLTLLSLMLDAAMFGMAPGAFHVTNLLLHMGGTLLLFLALRRMTGAAGRSALVAALFAVHPLHVESVAWVAERKDVLSTFFWMLTLWAWAGFAAKGTRRAYWLTLVSFALGLMTKPMLVTLPVTLLLLDAWPLQRLAPARPEECRAWTSWIRRWWPLVREKIPFFALAGAAGLVAVFAEGAAVASLEAIPAWTRAANALVGGGTYLVRTIWPAGLTVFYPLPASTPPLAVAAAFLALAVITAASYWLRGRAPYLLVGWLWYLVTLLPVSGIVQIGTHAMADRYTYVPLVGMFVMLAWGGASLVGPGRRRERAAGVAAAAIVLAFAVAARAQVDTWKDSGALWAHALAVTPGSYYAQHGMGSLLREQGKAREAVPYLQEAIRLNPRFPDARVNLGLAFEALGRTDEAVRQYVEALGIDPGMSDAHNNLGAVLLRSGRAEDAIPHFEAALRRVPDSAPAHDNLGQALAAVGRLPEAAAEETTALRLTPDFAEAHAHLGAVLAAQGKTAGAVAEYREAVRLAPGVADTHNNLGVALASLGEAGEAAAEFEQAVRLDPRHAQARVNLGYALARQGRTEEAILQFHEATRLEPDLELAHLYLGWALGGTGKRAEAAAELREVLRINPRSQDAQRALDLLAGRTPQPSR
jgi:tetratricopeptide (TPR) repeat protein